MANFERDLPDGWDGDEKELFADLVGNEPEILDDRELQLYFHEALFDRELDSETRAQMLDTLIDYLADEYDIDFELDFDWEDYREWYDGQAA